jgi:hypothetical protein
MDDDVREAMCNPDYDNGELEDDIMQQMMALAENDSDEEETFDYDAHIAKLIAESEGDLGLVDELSSGEEDDDIENIDVDQEETSFAQAVQDMDGGEKAKIRSLQQARMQKDFEKVSYLFLTNFRCPVLIKCSLHNFASGTFGI